MDVDSRTGDAVAIARRTGAPIFTTPKVVEETGYVWRRKADKPLRRVRLEDLPVEKLEQRLQHYVNNEEYERAAKIQKIIERKTNAPQGDGNRD